jgi:hypothetical protein
MLSCVAVGLADTGNRATAAPAPQCTFDGSSLPLVTGVSAGSKIAISCTGMGVLHPYLVIGASLLLGIDPAAAPLLSGQLVSLAGLNALLKALPEIDLLSEALPISGLNGNFSLDWTVPAFQPLDPNAGCPPTQKEFNSGLLGCAVAMIDLTTFKPVGAGSAVFEYKGFPLLPPNPTLAVSPTSATPNQTVHISDAPGATTYWWLPTLAKLESALGGAGGSSPTVTVTLVDPHGHSVPVTSQAEVVPASYADGVFSPPSLSGSFVVPSTVGGPETVKVQVDGALNGLPLSISASAPMTVPGFHITTAAITPEPATIGAFYQSGPLQATGGITPYKWKVTAGALPRGLRLGSSTGVISGTVKLTKHSPPPGLYPFTVTVTDHTKPVHQSATANFTITLVP